MPVDWFWRHEWANTPMNWLRNLWRVQKEKQMVSGGTVVTGEAPNEFCRLKFCTRPAKTKHNDRERTNGIVRQQTARWHRRQHQFGKVWKQTQATTRLVVTYFNWIWSHSRLKTSAAQPWTWHDIITYPTTLWCTIIHTLVAWLNYNFTFSIYP